MLSQLTACSLVAAFAGGCVLDVDDPIAERQRPIVNGQINNGDPALGLVVMIGVGSCSGTMVSDRVVLTARHCVLLEDGSVVPPEDIVLLWGTTPQQGDPTTQVVSHQYHPTADIAVLELATPGPAEPIPMNTTALEPYLGMPVRVAGYGVTSEDGVDAGIKRVGTTALFDFAPQTGLGNVMLIGNTGSQTCYGDSGGPAFMDLAGTGNERIVGVTSFGTGPCGEPTTLDGEIRVDIYHSWIMDFILVKDPTGLPGAEPPPPEPTPDPEPDPGDTDPDPEPQPDPSAGADPPDATGPTAVDGDIIGGCAIRGDGAGGGAGGALALIAFVALALVARPRRRA